MLPLFPIEVFADDSQHSFPIHFLDEILAITFQSRRRDVSVCFGVEAVAFQVPEPYVEWFTNDVRSFAEMTESSPLLGM